MKAYAGKDIKNMNRNTIYRCIVSNTEQIATCAGIARKTHISLPTVIKITEFLKERNLLHEVEGVQSSAIGRPPGVLKFNPDAYLSVGALYNGKFLEITVVNLNYVPLVSRRVWSGVSVDELMGSFFADTLESLINEQGIDRNIIIGIGLALPVILDTTTLKTEHPAPFIGLSKPYDFNASAKTISKRFGCSFYMENDVNSAALGEFKSGQYDEKDDLIFITLGKGIGAGIILDGRLRRGKSYTAGEIGYMIFNPEHLPGKDEAGYTESKLTPEFLQEQFGYSVYDDEELKDEGKKIRVAEHISSYLSLCISNLSIALDVGTFVLGGFLLRGIEDVVVRFTQEKIARYGLNPIKLKVTEDEYTASLGIGALAIDKSVNEILSGN